MALYANGYKVAPVVKGAAKVIPLSVVSNIDLDLSQYQLCHGVLGDGVTRTDRAFPTGSSLSAGYFHYDVEVKFRKTAYPT